MHHSVCVSNALQIKVSWNIILICWILYSGALAREARQRITMGKEMR